MKLIMTGLAEYDEPDWTISLKVSSQIVDLTPGRNYAILKFEKSSDVPQKNFLASKTWTNSWYFKANSSTHDMTGFDYIKSDQSTFYRVVEYRGKIPTKTTQKSTSTKKKSARLSQKFARSLN
jgi:hypothetical protein